MIMTMFRKNKFMFLIAIIVSFIYSFNGVLISSIVNFAGKFNNNTSLKDILIFSVIALSGWTVVYLANYICSVLQARIIKNTNLYYKINLIKNNWYAEDTKDNSSNIISILMNDFKLIEDNYLKEAFNLFDSILTLLVSLIYMLTLNKAISLIFIMFSLLPLIAPIFFNKVLNAATQEWTKQNSSLIDQLKDFFSGLETIKTYGKKPLIFNLIRLNVTKVEESQFRLVLRQSGAQFIGSAVAGISFIIPFVLGCVLMINSHSVSIPTLLAIFLANDRVISPIMNIASSVNEMNSTKNIRMNIQNYLKKNNFREKKSNRDSNYRGIKSFKIENIQYKIKNSNITLHCNFSINYNDKILIIGESGIGKSTLLKIIDGIIRPDKGEIIELVNGQKILEPFNDIAYINQSPYIFSTSIIKNVTLFEDNVNYQKMQKILTDVGLESFAKEKLRDVRLKKNGISVSGGQKQKIEIARALFSNKSLILADEITANLDKNNAEKIRDLLFRISNPVIEVAHHFNVNDNRYTKIYRLNVNGNLDRIK